MTDKPTTPADTPSAAETIRELAERLRKIVTEVTDEVHAATVYIMDRGKIEGDTPQSKRLIGVVQKLKLLSNHKPTVPADYPRDANPEI